MSGGGGGVRRLWECAGGGGAKSGGSEERPGRLANSDEGKADEREGGTRGGLEGVGGLEARAGDSDDVTVAKGEREEDEVVVAECVDAGYGLSGVLDEKGL